MVFHGKILNESPTHRLMQQLESPLRIRKKILEGFMRGSILPLYRCPFPKLILVVIQITVCNITIN